MTWNGSQKNLSKNEALLREIAFGQGVKFSSLSKVGEL